MADIKSRIDKLEMKLEILHPSKHNHWWVAREDPKTGKPINADGTPWVDPCGCGMGTTIILTRHPPVQG